jgi:hypothetical protein
MEAFACIIVNEIDSNSLNWANDNENPTITKP